ncbi:hypothetical protein MCEGE10_02853 [Flavobacteriaceae bacterium]
MNIEKDEERKRRREKKTKREKDEEIIDFKIREISCNSWLKKIKISHGLN